jgi:hypothetical protein
MKAKIIIITKRILAGNKSNGKPGKSIVYLDPIIGAASIHNIIINEKNFLFVL